MKKIITRLLLVFSILAAGLAVTSCDVNDSYNDYETRWFLSGTWQCMQYPAETICFYRDGTGHWEDNISGDYEDFDYYCFGNSLRFRWYPSWGPSYLEDCTIYVTNDNAIQITYPPSAGYGPTTLYYSRVY